MNRIHTDQNFRETLHGLYGALHAAHRRAPKDFHHGRLTTILTGVMGIEDIGWRVVGITPEALTLLAVNDFKRPPRALCRGHIIDRVTTVRRLFDLDQPLPLSDFFEIFIESDRTVIMTNEQNRVKGAFPDFIPIDNPEAALFPNGSLMGWKHRKVEREFLRNLHASLEDVTMASKVQGNGVTTEQMC